MDLVRSGAGAKVDRPSGEVVVAASGAGGGGLVGEREAQEAGRSAELQVASADGSVDLVRSGAGAKVDRAAGVVLGAAPSDVVRAADWRAEKRCAAAELLIVLEDRVVAGLLDHHRRRNAPLRSHR